MLGGVGVVSRFPKGGFKVLVWSCSLLPGPPFRDPSLGRPSPAPFPKFRSIFPLSRRKIHFFLHTLGVFSLNFGGVLKTGTLKCTRLEFSAVV